MSGIRSLLICALAGAALALVACGGGGDSTSISTSTSTSSTASTGTSDVAAADCDSIEEVDVQLSGQHLDKDFTADDYPTNPPTGGDHNPTPLQAGQFYTDPPRLGEAVHLLEHGAVIGWTNNLSAADQNAVEAAFNDVFKDGYYQLATVENPDLDVPFALSAWGALQKCAKVDTSVIRPFVEQWYASPKTAEGGLACQDQARSLPNC
ncbi:MAG: hypothetical protein QOI10_3059 [Solirubrobacterales bacterium]|jgi:hypothetical protein|nr:hypothetical protein [Solirubrobacterales bacterium]